MGSHWSLRDNSEADLGERSEADHPQLPVPCPGPLPEPTHMGPGLPAFAKRQEACPFPFRPKWDEDAEASNDGMPKPYDLRSGGTSPRPNLPEGSRRRSDQAFPGGAHMGAGPLGRRVGTIDSVRIATILADAAVHQQAKLKQTGIRAALSF